MIASLAVSMSTSIDLYVGLDKGKVQALFLRLVFEPLILPLLNIQSSKPLNPPPFQLTNHVLVSFLRYWVIAHELRFLHGPAGGQCASNAVRVLTAISTGTKNVRTCRTVVRRAEESSPERLLRIKALHCRTFVASLPNPSVNEIGR